MLVIHGGPDWDHSYLREPLAELAGRHRLILPDLRGCGRSTRGLDDAQYTPDAVVADLLDLADHLGLSRMAVLGFSYGGLIAQRLAVAAPLLVSKLVIASSHVIDPDDPRFEQWPERRRRLAAQADVWADARTVTPQTTRTAAIAGAPADVWRPEKLPSYLARLERVRFTAEWQRPWRAGTLPTARLADPINRLSQTQIPILLLHGRQDMRFAATSAERAAELVPTARAVILENAGHMAHVDQPEQWLDEVARFLS